MPAVKTKRISTLIESQLPEFISTEYELFGKFVQKYYEAQEVQGGTLDVINNLQKYADINFYEQNLLKQKDTLAVSINDTDTTITVVDASSFPEKNGYVRIEDEIIFYETRTDTELQKCARGVSGNTTLGDLYDSSNFKSTTAASHVSGKEVHNVSNLFLYAFVKNFENQYLGGFPEKYLKGEVDKRTLIKNIQKFYRAKGTTSSIKFIFNSIVAQDVDNKPEVYNPRDFTYKASESDWVNVYALKCKVISGDPKSLIGQKIVQQPTDEYEYSSSTVDTVYEDGTSDGEVIWNIVLAPETVNGEFAVSTKTRLERPLPDSYGVGKKIDVHSTVYWNSFGEVLVGSELIKFDRKVVNQFNISERNNPVSHPQGTSVYKPVVISGSGVELLTLGVTYNLSVKDAQPYSFTDDKVQVSEPGFRADDAKILALGSNNTRWILNQWNPVSSPTNLDVSTSLSDISTNVSAIFEDEQNYYITSSGWPTYNILDRYPVDVPVQDQQLLRIIRKEAITTTETYKTPKSDIGVLVNGVRLFGFRDEESIRYGKLQFIDVSIRGRGYNTPPYVLVDGLPFKATAVMVGQVVDSIQVNTQDIFVETPTVEITSGRGAVARAVVTRGEVTSIVVENAGEFYSSPPLIRIRDKAGRGKFAEYISTIDNDGSISSIDKVSGGNLYTQENVIVDILPVGEGATAVPYLKEWNKNRFEINKTKLDSQYGYVFANRYNVLEYGYGQLANPKAIRVQLSDNLDSADSEPSVKTHSPILGFAYDGNPIYGPFGYTDPLDGDSGISRMTSSFSLKGNRREGPAIKKYPLGTFIDDYQYSHKSGTLDRNNGRYCITPDFPEGTYAYFITVDSNQVPQFPYVLGENYYSLPVDSNYNSLINQKDIPKKAKRFFTAGMPRNGEGLVANIGEVSAGSVTGLDIQRSTTNFSVNSKVFLNNLGTGGKDCEVLVESVKGKEVQYLQSKEDKVVKLTTIQNAYLFEDDFLRQPASGASGQIVGTVTDDNVIVLKNVIGTFNNTGTFSADIKTFIITVDQDSNYTKGAILSLTDGINPPIATGEILEGTSRQNVVKIKVLSGTWVVNEDYFLQSDNLFNTSGSRIVTIVSLSDNLEPFEVNQRVALIETTTPHGLGINDKITVDINPEDNTKTETWYVRKRLYQEVIFNTPKNSSVVEFDGIGRITILNGGADYTEGLYTNVPITGGSGTGATATIQVSADGLVSSITLQSGGTGYRRGDYLGVDDDQLQRSGASLSSARLAVYVDHAGISFDSNTINLKSSNGFAVNDIISIGSEIAKIVAITDNRLTVERAQEDSEAVDHYNGAKVSLYKPRYHFTPDYAISNEIGTGFIRKYDFTTQKATIVYNYSVEKESASDVTISTTFFDAGSPERLVTVSSIGNLKYRFEFSQDNLTFTPNPIISIQEYYRYIFDTSHSSLIGTYFDLSPSKSYNLLTLEKFASGSLPGSTGAFTDVKFGFGWRSANVVESEDKLGTNYLNFYYFDNNNIVESDDAYFKIINDPLQGEKTINYVTSNRFVYDLPAEPLWDGSGNITYTTTGQFAVGEINTVKIINTGENYKKVPLILGVRPTENNIGTATVLFDTVTNTISGVNIDNLGSGYVNPIAIITDGDGVGASFRVVQREGKLFSVTVDKQGQGYTYAPTIEIIESDVEMYAKGEQIGLPRTVNIIKNGAAYHLDKTIASKVTSKYTVSLKNFSGKFKKGELITQSINNSEVLRARVSEYREGSNLVKLENIEGIIRENVVLKGYISKATGVVTNVFVSTFENQISSFFDNLGYYTSDKGRLGVANQKLTDSFFYQDYSYVVKSKTSIEQWRDLIKSTTHPAGFKLFGQVDVETSAKSEMPSSAGDGASSFTILQLWDPEKNKITVENTRRVVTQTVQKIENTRIRKGSGSAATSEFNFNETRSFNFLLAAPFDGYFNEDGKLTGTTSFQVVDEFGNAFFPINAESLIVTLDGILQEPKVAYTVDRDRIIFAQPPLGDNAKLTGQNRGATTPYKGVTFLGRAFSFKRSEYNTRYLKKIRNIFQRSGTWIDSANQIEKNRQFIIEETVGYGKQTHDSLDWSTKLDDYSLDIGHILDAYSHDLRFGGNAKTTDYADIFETSSDYITKNKVQSLDIFNYATRLAKLAVLNWDTTDKDVTYIQGSSVVTVSNSDKLAVGMFISSGRAFSPETKIVSIEDVNHITVSKPALANSGAGPGGAAFGQTNLSGTTSGSTIISTNTGVVQPGNEFSVQPGDELIVPLSFSGTDEATFFMSGINNGTFYDASNLIASNKEYLQEEVSGFVYSNYTLTDGGRAKCYRDLGFLIDNIVYHLRFGGNERVVNFAQLYYSNRGYPYGEELNTINRSPEETTASIAAWDKLAELMVLAMRNTLGAGSHTTIEPFVDSTVTADSQLPTCIEVESSINTYVDIVKEILSKGTGVVEIVNINQNKPGYWTTRTTYSNYNILPDPLIPDSECADVMSAVDSLYSDLRDILYNVTILQQLPDYIDGETKEFDLYWEDGTEVISEDYENFLITINAVLQETKFNASYPGDDSYYIDRTVIPNKLVFDVAPIWDQYEGAKTLGEPTAVEKVSAVGIGNYKRLTIDRNLIDNVRKGPFLILDLEDLTVANIEEPSYLLVFIDGVLQQKGVSYNVSGPNIRFTVPITSQMKIDMRYLYGRDIGQILNLYDYNKDIYYAKGSLSIKLTSNANIVEDRSWMGYYKGLPIQLVQERSNGTYNVIGEVLNYKVESGYLKADVFGYKSELLDRDLTLLIKQNYNISLNCSIDLSDSSIAYDTDETGRMLLSGNDQIWRGTIIRKSHRDPFVSLSNNTNIRVEGEDAFRKIKQLPSSVTSREQRPQEQVSNSYFASVEVQSYNGTTRGEGLSIVPIMEKDGNGQLTGRIERLDWNQRSYDPITQPTAYQYYTPPVIVFVSQNGDGGGARANVLVSKGQVISVDLTDPGSGYTEEPSVIVSRKYDVIKDNDIGVDEIFVGFRPSPLSFSLTSSSTINILGNQVSGIDTFSSVLFNSPVASDRVITAQLQLVEDCGDQLTGGIVAPILKIDDQFDRQTIPIETVHAATEIYFYIDTPADVLNIFSESTSLRLGAERQVTQNIQKVITNDVLSNINYYEVAAFLNVDLDPTDTVVYIPDTSKFKTNGYLMIGNEVVRYFRKINDRFLTVSRGEDNTTAQFWAAGTYLRQIPDLVASTYAGVTLVESDSQVVTIQLVPSEQTVTERNTNRQIVTPDVSPVQTTRVIELELQPQIAVESISNVQAQVVYKLETALQNVQSFETAHNETNVRNELQKQIEEFYTFNVSQTVIAVSVDPIVESTSYITFVTDSVSVRPSETVTTIDSITYNETTVSSTVQSIRTELFIRKNSLELLLIPPGSGAVDGYEESIFVTDPVQTRLNGFVDLTDDYGVVQRNSNVVFITNLLSGASSGYIGDYAKTNAGHTISHFDGFFDDGFANVSGMTIEEVSLYYSSLSIKDFSSRGNSSFTISGEKFNLAPPSIQNPVTFSSSEGSIGGPIIVQDTTYFPDEGFLFHSVKGIPSATGTPLGQRRFGIAGNVNLETNTDPRFGDTCVFLNEDNGLSNGGEYLSAAQPLGTGNFTVQFWFKPGTDPGFPNYSNLIYYGSSGGAGVGYGPNQNQADIGWSIQMNNTDTATPLLSLWNGETQNSRSCGTCNRGSWNHIAIEREDGVIKVYVNGSERASAANTQEYNNGTMGNNTNPFFAIGFDNATSYDSFHGHIDNVHVQSAATYNGMPATYGQPDQYTLLLENFDTPSTTYSGVIQYTSKTATTFEGCTFVNGDNNITNGSEMVPFTK